MVEFAEARRMMVDGQIRTNDVTDPRILATMLEVPRERFVPRGRQQIAYLDRDIEVSTAEGRTGRYLVKPMVLARMLQVAGLSEDALVLDVGCATGYGSAVMARLARAVVALDDDPGLLTQAEHTLAELGIGNVTVRCGPLPQGAPAEGPYDVIVLEGAAEIVPKILLAQLRDGGRLVGVCGSQPARKITVYRANDGHVTAQQVFDASAPILPGFAKPLEFVF